MPLDVKKSPFFGGIAAVFAVLVFALPLAIVVSGFREGGPVDRQDGWGGLGAMVGLGMLAMLAGIVMALGGFFTGMTAMIRGERYRLLAWLGFLTGGGILTAISLALINGQH